MNSLRRCGPVVTGLMCAAVLGLSGLLADPSAAQNSKDDMARRHFDSGAAYLEESDYENALAAFSKSFELSGRPAIQINLATVHERMGGLALAIGALDKYLELSPDGDHAETVRLRKQNLEKRLAKQPPVAEPDAGADAESDAGAPVVVAPPPPAKKKPPEPKTKPKPLPEEDDSPVAAYILLGLGGLSAGGAVITGVLANSEYDDADENCAPNCSDDDLSTGRSMALTSTILTGAAVVSLGVGLFLLLAEDGDPKSDSAHLPPNPYRPQLFVGAHSSGASARARWSF